MTLTNTRYTDQDAHFMSMALNEAKQALDAGDYPVGAALTLDGKLVGTGRNTLFTDLRWSAHAEHNLLYEQSAYLLQKCRNKPRRSIYLYTTLEPCLMCLGIALLHRVSKIIVACPDPNGGTSNLQPADLGSFYQYRWPTFHIGLFKEASYDLIIEFLKTEKFTSWETMLTEFQTMKAGW